MKPTSVLSPAFLVSLLLLLQGGGHPQHPASRPAGKGGLPFGRPPFPGLPPGGKKGRKPSISPLLGAWEIRKAYFPGAPPSLKTRGYAVFTRTFASFHVFLQESHAEPLFQSGFWRYSYRGGRLHFQSLLGLRTAPGGRLLPDRKGSVHERIPQFLSGGVLRLYKAGGSYLEMIRLE